MGVWLDCGIGGVGWEWFGVVDGALRCALLGGWFGLWWSEGCWLHTFARMTACMRTGRTTEKGGLYYVLLLAQVRGGV